MALNTTEMVSIENRDPGDEDVIQAEKDRMTAVWAGLSTAIVDDSEYYASPVKRSIWFTLDGMIVSPLLIR